MRKYAIGIRLRSWWNESRQMVVCMARKEATCLSLTHILNGESNPAIVSAKDSSNRPSWNGGVILRQLREKPEHRLWFQPVVISKWLELSCIVLFFCYVESAHHWRLEFRHDRYIDQNRKRWESRWKCDNASCFSGGHVPDPKTSMISIREKKIFGFSVGFHSVSAFAWLLTDNPAKSNCLRSFPNQHVPIRRRSFEWILTI